ncbi:MAG: relaxase/mobilization nuclease domain-containing protein [Pyrinomonadaceae bacterium]
MIGKITGGASFGGALDYLTKPKEPKDREEKERYQERLKDAQHTPGEPAPPFEAGERHRVIGGNMSGQTKGELAQEFKAISRQRPDIEKPVHHASLSTGESDRITVQQWNEIAEKYIEQMGFKDAPYVIIQHRDGKTDHVHILTSRVDVQGKVVSDWQCKERAELVMREIEREYGLEQVKSSREVERAAPKRGELERFNRTGELSAKMSMQSHVELALKDSPTATEFIEKLQLVGVDVIPYIQKDGRTTGISFRQSKQVMKGSDLGRGFSWNALQERGLDYQQERDRPAIEAARLRADQPRAQTINAPTISTTTIGTPAPERAFTDFAKELLAPQSISESLQRAAGLVPDGKDTIERLHQAAGIAPGKDDHDAIDRLNKSVGLEREDQHTNLTPVLDQTLEHTSAATHTLEREPAERTIEHEIEFSR